MQYAFLIYEILQYVAFQNIAPPLVLDPTTLLLVKKQCRICGQCEMIPVTAYKSAMKEATRVTIYYSDSTSNTIDTGDVSV